MLGLLSFFLDSCYGMLNYVLVRMSFTRHQLNGARSDIKSLCWYHTERGVHHLNIVVSRNCWCRAVPDLRIIYAVTCSCLQCQIAQCLMKAHSLFFFFSFPRISPYLDQTDLSKHDFQNCLHALQQKSRYTNLNFCHLVSAQENKIKNLDVCFIDIRVRQNM